MSGIELASVPRVDHIGRREFLDSYLNPLVPAVIKDLACSWPALSKWTPEFFKTQYGHKQVKVYDAGFVEAGGSYMSSARTLPLREYIDLVMTTSQDLRMFLYNIKSAIPELTQDVELPAIAPGISRNFLFMFFGCKGSVTQMHFDIDMSHVFHTAIWGKKTITLFPYEQAWNLYRAPFTCRSYIDIHAPDFDKYPRLKDVKGYQVTLEPGETLFMPSGYWHHIVYDEPGFALSLRCSPQSMAAKLHGLYNLFIMSPIDRIMNKISPQGWFRWKEQKIGLI